jgi:hypothetical protein
MACPCAATGGNLYGQPAGQRDDGGEQHHEIAGQRLELTEDGLLDHPLGEPVRGRPWEPTVSPTVLTGPGRRRPMGARTHSGRERSVAPPRTAFPLVSGILLGWSGRAVKPSAKPSLVRTQHLPPPAETSR